MASQQTTAAQGLAAGTGIFGLDAFAPAEIAEKVEQSGVAKAKLALFPMFMLGVVAGGSIGLGALYYTTIASDASLSFAVSRVLGGLVFAWA